MMRTETLSLPFPPSVNHYWLRNKNGKGMRISDAAKAFREEVGWRVKGFGTFGSRRLSVCVTVHAPDNRRRDLDNFGKAICDSLQHAGMYDDDSQIDELVFRRGEVRRDDPCILVKLTG